MAADLGAADILMLLLAHACVPKTQFVQCMNYIVIALEPSVQFTFSFAS